MNSLNYMYRLSSYRAVDTPYQLQQDTQFTYNVILRHVRATTVALGNR